LKPTATSTRFGRALRRMREARGWTQVQLAVQARLSQSHISKMEAGERQPSWTMLRHLVRAGLEPRDLLLLRAKKKGVSYS